MLIKLVFVDCIWKYCPGQFNGTTGDFVPY